MYVASCMPDVEPWSRTAHTRCVCCSVASCSVACCVLYANLHTTKAPSSPSWTGQCTSPTSAPKTSSTLPHMSRAERQKNDRLPKPTARLCAGPSTGPALIPVGNRRTADHQAPTSRTLQLQRRSELAEGRALVGAMREDDGGPECQHSEAEAGKAAQARVHRRRQFHLRRTLVGLPRTPYYSNSALRHPPHVRCPPENRSVPLDHPFVAVGRPVQSATKSPFEPFDPLEYPWIALRAEETTSNDAEPDMHSHRRRRLQRCCNVCSRECCNARVHVAPCMHHATPAHLRPIYAALCCFSF
jgi:hypothetical protein